MSNENMKRYSADDIRDRVRRGESRTDFARVDALSEVDLERAISSDPDWKGIPENWHEQAEAAMPKPKVLVSIRLDSDLIDYFRSTGRGWQTRVNSILRAYKEVKTLSDSRGGEAEARRDVEAV